MMYLYLVMQTTALNPEKVFVKSPKGMIQQVIRIHKGIVAPTRVGLERFSTKKNGNGNIFLCWSVC